MLLLSPYEPCKLAHQSFLETQPTAQSSPLLNYVVLESTIRSANCTALDSLSGFKTEIYFDRPKLTCLSFAENLACDLVASSFIVHFEAGLFALVLII